MDGKKLKNIVIIILALVNLFLLSIVLLDRGEARARQSELRENTLSYMRRSGVTPGSQLELELDIPGQFSARRDVTLEFEAAQNLLGEVELAEPGGSVRVYSGEFGNATFWGGGNFELHFTDGPAESLDLEKQTRELLFKLGMYASREVLVTDDGNGGKTVTALCTVNSLPVWRAEISVSFLDGYAVSITGYRPFDTVSAPDVSESLDPVSIITRFLEYARTEGLEPGEILELEPGYDVTETASGESYFDPVWRVSTDIGDFYLSGLTGRYFRSGNL